LTNMTELFSRILEASTTIYPQVSVTPLERSNRISAELGCQVLLKYEHMQPTGSFKIRGATNKVRLLDGQFRRSGVLTASTGNHGVAVARAGALAGVPVRVYVSNATVPTKLAGIRARGAELVLVDGPPLEAELAARRRAEADGTLGAIEPGSVTFPICQAVIDARVVVSEAEIAAAMSQLAETEDLMVEGAAAVALAGLIRCAHAYRGRKVSVVLCGRNIGPQRFMAAIGRPSPAAPISLP
jgi:threonine dehydratase